MSLNAQNEILQIVALKLLCGIVSDITESGYYSIMADESTDASNIEQLVICIWSGSMALVPPPMAAATILTVPQSTATA